MELKMYMVTVRQTQSVQGVWMLSDMISLRGKLAHFVTAAGTAVGKQKVTDLVFYM